MGIRSICLVLLYLARINFITNTKLFATQKGAIADHPPFFTHALPELSAALPWIRMATFVRIGWPV
jgi:hypothetical protein